MSAPDWRKHLSGRASWTTKPSDHPPFLSVSTFLFLPCGLSFAFLPFLLLFLFLVPRFIPLHRPLRHSRGNRVSLTVLHTRFSAQGMMHHGKLSPQSPLLPRLPAPVHCTPSLLYRILAKFSIKRKILISKMSLLLLITQKSLKLI